MSALCVTCGRFVELTTGGRCPFCRLPPSGSPVPLRVEQRPACPKCGGAVAKAGELCRSCTTSGR